MSDYEKGEKGNVKLYEVNQQLEELMARLEPDPETGDALDFFAFSRVFLFFSVF